MVAAGDVPALAVFGTRHASHDGIDAGTVALDFVDVKTPPRDAALTDPHDDDATLVKRRAALLGCSPVDLPKGDVTVGRRPEHLGLEVRDGVQQRGPVGPHLVDPIEGPG